MPSLPILFAPLALLLPLGLFGVPMTGEGGDQDVAQQTRDAERRISALPLSDEAPGWAPLLDSIAPEPNEQVRIERRVILRISPAPSPVRRNLTADAPRAAPQTRIVERPMGKCVNSAAIGGVADRGDHLLMFMRDRTTVAARLEKGCSPRDFYQGFYVERNDDGKLCIKRDRIMSRSGAKCQVAKFTQLVVERVD